MRKMEKLHPGIKWVFFLQYIFVFGFIFIWLGFFALGSLSSTFGILKSPGSFLTGFFIGVIILLVVIILFTILWANLSYNNWGFEFRKEGLYIKKGVIWKHYSSIPYERIQNIDIERGIIARMCGFSSLMIQTAGYSSIGGRFAEGSIPAVDVDKAEKYREWLLKKIRGKKQGL